jgi:hypothetical protein
MARATRAVKGRQEGGLKVLLVDPAGEGHHMDYVCMAYRAITSLGLHACWLISPATLEERAVVDRVAEIKGLEIAPELRECPGSGYSAGVGRVREIRSAVQRHRASWVYLMYADQLLIALGSLRIWHRRATAPFPAPVEALLFRDTMAYDTVSVGQALRSALRQYLIERSGADYLHLVDPVAAARYPHFGRRAPLASVLPDPVAPPTQSRKQARATLGLEESQVWVVLPGVIDGRKGWRELLRCQGALAKAEVGLCFLGPHEPVLRARLQQDFREALQSRQVVSVDRHLTGEELQNLLTAFDAVVVPYPGHVGSSSVALRAAAADVPVVGSDTAWMRRVVVAFDLGVVCDVTSPVALSAAILGVVGRKPREALRAARDALLKFHSEENFAAHLTERLAASIGVRIPGPTRWAEIEAMLDVDSASGPPPDR